MVKQPTCCSWAWKKILQLRVEVRLSFWCRIGDGLSTSLWFDNWHPRGPLNWVFSDVLIYNSGLSRETSVVDLYVEDGQALRSVLESWEIPLPSLSLNQGCFCWKDNPAGFMVATAWEAFRRKKPRILWHRFIWNNAITPRYQFHLWLVTKHRFPTQAFLLSYGRIDTTFCPFCEEVPDSIDHLFFECRVTANLAFFWATRCNLPWRNRSWNENLL